MGLGHVGAFDQDAVRVLQVLRLVVAPPLPYVMPRPGTVELCHIRAWFVIRTNPKEWKSLVMR